MGKVVFPDDSTIFVKSGTTEYAIASDTGGLYHQGTILPDSSMLAPLKVLTWGSTAAHTLVGTTLTQDLTNKTLNAGTSPSTATHTLVATTVTQDLTNKTLNAGTSPSTATHTLVGTTVTQDLTNKTLNAGTSPSTATHTLVGTTVAQTMLHKTWSTGCVFETAAGTSDATIPNCGLTTISATTSPFTATLAAPLAGILKFIHVSAANTTDLVTVNASTAVEFGVVNSTDSYRNIIFSCKGSAMLLGVSTARWDVLSLGTTLVGTSTLPTFTT